MFYLLEVKSNLSSVTPSSALQHISKEPKIAQCGQETKPFRDRFCYAAPALVSWASEWELAVPRASNIRE